MGSSFTALSMGSWRGVGVARVIAASAASGAGEKDAMNHFSFGNVLCVQTRKRVTQVFESRILLILVMSCSLWNREGPDGNGVCLASFLRMIFNPLPTRSEALKICPAVSPPNTR